MGLIIKKFDPAYPDEDEYYALDFVNDLPEADTLLSAVCSLAAIVGTDASASSRLVGSPIVSGTKVEQEISGLQAGVTYRLHVLGTTAGGQKLGLSGDVECRAVN